MCGYANIEEEHTHESFLKVAAAVSVLGDSWGQEASPRYGSGAGVSGAAAV